MSPHLSANIYWCSLHCTPTQTTNTGPLQFASPANASTTTPLTNSTNTHWLYAKKSYFSIPLCIETRVSVARFQMNYFKWIIKPILLGRLYSHLMYKSVKLHAYNHSVMFWCCVDFMLCKRHRLFMHEQADRHDREHQRATLQSWMNMRVI